jgi:hypothetical protein
LKQFFRDLPDPLLTLEYHDSFIAAASTFFLLFVWSTRATLTNTRRTRR